MKRRGFIKWLGISSVAATLPAQAEKLAKALPIAKPFEQHDPTVDIFGLQSSTGALRTGKDRHKLSRKSLNVMFDNAVEEYESQLDALPLANEELTNMLNSQNNFYEE